MASNAATASSVLSKDAASTNRVSLIVVSSPGVWRHPPIEPGDEASPFRGDSAQLTPATGPGEPGAGGGEEGGGGGALGPAVAPRWSCTSSTLVSMIRKITITISSSTRT